MFALGLYDAMIWFYCSKRLIYFNFAHLSKDAHKCGGFCMSFKVDLEELKTANTTQLVINLFFLFLLSLLCFSWLEQWKWMCVFVCCHVDSVFSIFSALDAPWAILLANIEPESTAVTVNGLIPARSYQFRLCAVNDVGKGQFSKETDRWVKDRPFSVHQYSPFIRTNTEQIIK